MAATGTPYDRFMVLIRPACTEDFDLVDRIENEADRLLIEQLNPEQWEPVSAGPSRASEPGFILIAEVDSGVVVGFVQVIEADGIAHLEQLSVLPEHGRHGYGRSLVEAAKDEARIRGYHQLTLRTYAEIPWNAPFYASAGFAEEEPATPFHHALIRIEAERGLNQYGRRIQMAARLMELTDQDRTAGSAP